MNQINSSMFLAEAIPDGYSWTLTTRLGQALRMAEEKFGERDKTWTILGVEFVNSEQPQIWYPGNCKNIAIQLTSNALTDVNRALYQLSHEVVHCISPLGGIGANVLEEGLATYFSEWYTAVTGSGEWHPDIVKYQEALALAKLLLGVDPDIIKKVRKIQPIISFLTPKDFLKINIDLDRDLLDKLCSPFNT